MINKRLDRAGNTTYLTDNSVFYSLSAAEHSQWLKEQLRPAFTVVLQPSGFRIPCRSRLEATKVQAERGGEIHE